MSELLLGLGTELALRIFDAKVGPALNRGSIRDRLAAASVPVLEARRAEREFERVAESIARSLSTNFHHEYSEIPDNEVRAAIDAVRRGFQASMLSTDVLIDSNLEPLEIERHVEEALAPLLSGFALSAAAEALRARLVHECSYYISELAQELPSVQSRMFVEMLRRESIVVDKVDALLAAMPKPESAHVDGDEAFEARYRRELASKLDRLQLFGLTVADEVQRYRLTVAYISLVLKSGTGAASASSDPDSDVEVEQSVEAVLCSGSRLAIRGEAGSGKTTLLQWLAVNASRASLTGELADLNARIPYFIQLRRFVGARMPKPEEFVTSCLPLLAEHVPDGWVSRTLDAGRAIVLVDGLDELPEAQRSDVAEWLEDLDQCYPGSYVIVTSRPPALSAGWISRGRFDSFELQPMADESLASFIDHWHRAAAETVTDPATIEEIYGYGRALKEITTTVPSIRSLAGTPLLCAMLCALNRDRRTHLPKDRMELYRISLETLLERRDAERRVDPSSLQLSLNQKLALLQHLAYHMLVNGASDASRETVVGCIERKLIAMPSVAAGAEETFVTLLTRSGVLREPVVGKIDFAHRTFQEYLGAREAVAQDCIGFLLEKAYEDQWRETVILACGHASPKQRDELVGGLLDRATVDVTRRHVYELLAVACLETAQDGLSADLYQRIVDSLQDLFPPESMSDARALSSAGTLALPYLAHQKNWRATQSAAAVRTLANIGGGQAMSMLIDYASDGRARKTVLREIVRAWGEFDIEQYASTVIDAIHLPLPYLRTSSFRYANALRGSRGVRKVDFAVPFDASSLAPLIGHDRIQSIAAFRHPNLADISALPDIYGLSSIDIEACENDIDLDPLRHCSTLRAIDAGHRTVSSLEFLPQGDSLRSLMLRSVDGLDSLGGIDKCERLELLDISGTHVGDTTALRGLSNLGTLTAILLTSLADLMPSAETLTSLTVGGIVADVHELGALSNLESLRFALAPGSSAQSSASAWDSIASLEKLSILALAGFESIVLAELSSSVIDLTIQDSGIRSVEGIPSSIQSLTIIDCDALESVSGLADAAPHLRRVEIVGCPNLRDRSEFARLSKRVLVRVSDSGGSGGPPNPRAFFGGF